MGGVFSVLKTVVVWVFTLPWALIKLVWTALLIMVQYWPVVVCTSLLLTVSNLVIVPQGYVVLVNNDQMSKRRVLNAGWHLINPFLETVVRYRIGHTNNLLVAKAFGFRPAVDIWETRRDVPVGDIPQSIYLEGAMLSFPAVALNVELSATYRISNPSKFIHYTFSAFETIQKSIEGYIQHAMSTYNGGAHHVPMVSSQHIKKVQEMLVGYCNLAPSTLSPLLNDLGVTLNMLVLVRVHWPSNFLTTLYEQGVRDSQHLNTLEHLNAETRQYQMMLDKGLTPTTIEQIHTRTKEAAAGLVWTEQPATPALKAPAGLLVPKRTMSSRRTNRSMQWDAETY